MEWEGRDSSEGLGKTTMGRKGKQVEKITQTLREREDSAELRVPSYGFAV
jgi:hypothetical protein